MKIKIPRRAVVIITGPSCSGKTCLSERILKAAPAKDKVLHSEDEVMLGIIEREPALRRVVYELSQNGFVGETVRPCEVPIIDSALEREREKVLKEEHDLIIIEGLLLDLRQVTTVLRQICLGQAIQEARRDSLGRSGELVEPVAVVLIKLSLNPATLFEFCQKRPEIKHQYGISVLQTMMLSEVIRIDFNSEFITEYLVSDPRLIELVFEP